MREPGQSFNNHAKCMCGVLDIPIWGTSSLLGSVVLYTTRAIFSHWKHIVLMVGVR